MQLQPENKTNPNPQPTRNAAHKRYNMRLTQLCQLGKMSLSVQVEAKHTTKKKKNKTKEGSSQSLLGSE